MKTKTGSFPIGWRNRELSWEDSLEKALAFGKKHDLWVVDLKSATPEALETCEEAGFTLGSVDLPNWKGMIAKDPVTRDAALKENRAFVREIGSQGVQNFFVVMLPEDPSLSRTTNFELMVDSYQKLGETLDEVGSTLVIEGWPGAGSLVTTPETYRALLENTPDCIGVNYDPSHLVRMGIDPIRFLSEFLPRTYHAHGKDALVDPERLYEYGSEVEALNGEKPAHGGFHWRYTIPGYGHTPWITVLEILKEGGYQGAISIEFEDSHFLDSPEREQDGVIQAAHFLAGC